MSLKKTFFLSSLILIFASNCKGNYALKNINIGNAKTFQVDVFQNRSNIIEPGLERDFTLALQDLILNQTELELVKNNGDLTYGGEITKYQISPTTPTSSNTAAQNRLEITVNVHFINKKQIQNKFEKQFTFFYDYPAKKQLIDNLKQTAHNEIFNRLTQDIINTSLSNW